MQALRLKIFRWAFVCPCYYRDGREFPRLHYGSYLNDMDTLSGQEEKMSGKQFERKSKEDRPVLAICYDFDKTLSPDDMQAQGYIQSVGYDIAEFWIESNRLAEENEMDQNLAYMFKMVTEAEGRLVFNRKTLAEHGAKVKLFPGVEDWFERIREYGTVHDVIVEHYIISSGLKEMIEGTSIAKNGAFEKIYASSFYYNARGVAQWPAQVVNYTNKTQFLFRIEKGVLDVNDPAVNDYFKPDEIRVPFRNMVYIGDSDTDIPCMKLVNTYGGHSIGVYDAHTKDKKKVYKMMRDNRIKFFSPADYTENSELDKLLKAIIERTAANEKLESAHFTYKNETSGAEQDNENLRKADLIEKLKSSRSFADTHAVVKELGTYKTWTEEQRAMLFLAAIDNQQVYLILKDRDVAAFYSQLIQISEIQSEAALKVKQQISEEV